MNHGNKKHRGKKLCYMKRKDRINETMSSIMQNWKTCHGGRNVRSVKAERKLRGAEIHTHIDVQIYMHIYTRNVG